jgi:predicted component of type VI protein secretion system
MDKNKDLVKIDFSQGAIQKAVQGKIIQNPVSMYSVALGTVGAIAAGILFPNLPLIICSAGLCIFGISSIIINFAVRKGIFETRYLAYLNRLLDRQKQLVLTRIKRELTKLSSDKGLKIYSDQAVYQFEKIQLKFDNFKRILSEKFDPAEITYGRFFGTTEQLYLSVLDNLEDIMNSLSTASNIDDAYIEERLQYLNGLSAPEDADKREMVTLNTRKELKQKSVERINELLTVNEEAMTEIDVSMSTISQTKTKMGRASVDMEVARQDLEELINRTKKYSISK